MDRNRYRCRKENPSFSSTLLDVISRSIDDDSKPMRMNRQSIDGCFHLDNQIADSVRRKSATGISSSEIYGFPARPRPIRTSISRDDECNTREMNGSGMYAQKHQLNDLQPNCQGKFVKTKSRAMRIYGYLKKGKHPISPGGRLATFLISLFSTTNTGKSKIQSPYTDETIVHANRKPKSASSFSRSCLSKTPSRAKLTTDMKRSVRFYPASVIVDEPPGVRSNSNGELKKHLTEKNRHIDEYVFDFIKNNVTKDEEEEARSYASSDLFELEHLSAIGIDPCMQELPLYETTSVDANRAIANGLLV
ncbi:hypothetical protein L1987_47718 [Smallanthus sonchifolius]|uniref:Uncharacterized protein n=1 Tax=Smallanthus sonchifolius TaxID=185202 RepID=A0ACB9G3D9_9ASTR|nr:hypothetical protein L1987_47718 [Smallanthus sonchifolius]